MKYLIESTKLELSENQKNLSSLNKEYSKTIKNINQLIKERDKLFNDINEIESVNRITIKCLNAINELFTENEFNNLSKNDIEFLSVTLDYTVRELERLNTVYSTGIIELFRAFLYTIFNIEKEL